ncbi:cystathionine gamma-lyase cys3 [Tilletia horrida]|uniref:cystathionine gamma-lyase n=1 Tax=Tilletia horrida TaxID=155126 RepID=A0AAN6GMV6_9BASI|nr:cystathionine gamma-lyase cys3 [Tilletia horrida]KAK0548633.1 cystathionine gamma-lyase cys3 [Tilletia horrida]KAK0562843.1 cystathionine gamma-lyase cys3 [Tilletia horrida]
MTPVPIATVPQSASAPTNGAEASHTDSFGFSTRAIHIGSEPSAETGAVIPAISLSTTFIQDGVGGLRGQGYEYSRSGNPNRFSLERAVANLEGGSHGFAFSSGSAVTGTILNALPPNSHVVSVNDVYGGTYRYFTKVASVHGIDLTFVDLEGDEAGVAQRLADALKPETKLVWIETPTNPTLKLVDIELVVRTVKKHQPDARVVVDNTFLSPYFQQPLALGADIVVHSATKYIGGHSDVVLGLAVTSDSAWVEKLKFLQNSIGAVPSPFDCWLALRSLKTLALRMRAHGDAALKVATFLESHPAVENVVYPGLASHPSHAVAVKQVVRRPGVAEPQASESFPYGGMVSFRLKSDPNDPKPADLFFSKLQVASLAESLGGVETLVELPSRMTHAAVAPEDRLKLGIGHNLIRLSVGVEDTDDIIADLKRGLAAAV